MLSRSGFSMFSYLLVSTVTDIAIIMQEQNYLAFPYEFKSIKPEEQEELDNKYNGIFKCSRVGPKGYIVYEPYKKDAVNIYNMPLRPTDVFVASYQRSGTTWTQELVWLVANDLDYTTAAEMPLVHRYPFLDIFMIFDLDRIDEEMQRIADPEMDLEKAKELFLMMGQPASRLLATMPENKPRFIKTHLPMSLLNPKLLDTSKMVYVARDPRDVAVSCYHQTRLFKIMRLPGGFKEFWSIFYRNLFVLCPIFEHVKEAWEKRHHSNMLFLFYEELSKDLPASIRRVAHFLGKTLTQEQIERLCDHLSIDNFKKNPSVNSEEIRPLGMLAKDETFIRKVLPGKAGGWRDYFDEEMTLQAERWIQDNLRDTDLRYPHM